MIAFIESSNVGAIRVLRQCKCAGSIHTHRGGGFLLVAAVRHVDLANAVGGIRAKAARDQSPSRMSPSNPSAGRLRRPDHACSRCRRHR